jgi:hypothetical protein
MPALPATFTIQQIENYGNWNAVLYKNDSSGRLFCAFESVSLVPVLRINTYLDNNDTFLEIHDPSWSKMTGRVSFTLAFDVPDHGITRIEFLGNSDGISYTHDILETDAFHHMLGLFAHATKLQVVNSNGGVLAEYSGSGTADALRQFYDCREGV